MRSSPTASEQPDVDGLVALGDGGLDGRHHRGGVALGITAVASSRLRPRRGCRPGALARAATSTANRSVSAATAVSSVVSIRDVRCSRAAPRVEVAVAELEPRPGSAAAGPRAGPSRRAGRGAGRAAARACGCCRPRGRAAPGARSYGAAGHRVEQLAAGLVGRVHGVAQRHLLDEEGGEQGEAKGTRPQTKTVCSESASPCWTPGGDLRRQLREGGRVEHRSGADLLARSPASAGRPRRAGGRRCCRRGRSS